MLSFKELHIEIGELKPIVVQGKIAPAADKDSSIRYAVLFAREINHPLQLHFNNEIYIIGMNGGVAKIK